MKRATESGRRQDDPGLQETIDEILDEVSRRPALLDDPTFHRHVYGMIRGVCEDDEEALRALSRMYVHARSQRNELLGAFRKLKDGPRRLGWVTSPPFDIGANGTLRRFIHVTAVAGSGASAPDLYEIVSAVDGPPMLPERIPCLCWVSRSEPPLFLGVANDIPHPPIGADLLEARGVPESPYRDLGVIEVADSGGRKYTVLAAPSLADEIGRRLKEGETAVVRVEGGVATGVHEVGEEFHEDWLEFLDEGPGLDGLVFPGWLAKEFRNDVRRLVAGRGYLIDLVGPTGVGKTDSVSRVGHDAVALARSEGREVKGLALIHISPSRIGSSLIHEVAVTVGRALRKANHLTETGWIVVVLLDEADALLAEAAHGMDHVHAREERLAIQSELSRETRAGIYITRNPRRNSTLPAAIARRARLRSFPRMHRTQLAAVASRYVSDPMLRVFGMSRGEFGGVFADRMFRDRVVAVAHLASGGKIAVHARDLQVSSPGKAKAILERYSEDLEYGEPGDLAGLWRTVDREIRAVDLTPENLSELTFLSPPTHDSIRSVEQKE